MKGLEHPSNPKGISVARRAATPGVMDGCKCAATKGHPVSMRSRLRITLNGPFGTGLQHAEAWKVAITGARPVRRTQIRKATGDTRDLGIPTVNDRVIQQAIAQVLAPLIDPTFSEASHGFRAGRNAHGAVRQIQGYIEEGYRVAVDVGLSKFFDRVDHDLLIDRLRRFTTDKGLLKLIG